tara:strand:- start:468 stop:1091 length:624 start_codon:yes stop_codon:yes gene_type:complete
VSSKIILPTAYFGPISYYSKIIKNDTPLVEINENFVKQTIRNRCYISGSNGKLRLTIPKQKINNTKSISSIKICYFENWQKNHWNAISSSYNSSPFFTYYKDELNVLFQKKEKYLIDLNNKAQNIILKILQYDKTIQQTSKYEKTGSFIDLRNYNWENDIIKNYEQVFIEKIEFLNNLSILDLIFNLGPESTNYLLKLNIQPKESKK